MRGNAMKRKLSYLMTAVAGAALALGLLVACSGGHAARAATGSPCDNSSANVTSQQVYQQCVTGLALKQFTTAEQYPLSAMRDSSELANLRARLIRLNDPNRIGYVYEMSQTGQVVALYTVRGKVSSMGSQMTTTDNAIGRTGNSDVGGTVVASPGDDGSYGPEECQSTGIFFFTADTDALVEWCGAWQYSDAPLHLATAPIITVSGSAPTSPIPAGGTSKKP